MMLHISESLQILQKRDSYWELLLPLLLISLHTVALGWLKILLFKQGWIVQMRLEQILRVILNIQSGRALKVTSLPEVLLEFEKKVIQNLACSDTVRDSGYPI